MIDEKIEVQEVLGISFNIKHTYITNSNTNTIQSSNSNPKLNQVINVNTPFNSTLFTCGLILVVIGVLSILYMGYNSNFIKKSE